MKVNRVIALEGIFNGEDLTVDYRSANVMHRNNDHWPREGFILTTTHEGRRIMLRMFGADIILFDGGDGFLLEGFVNTDEEAGLHGTWRLEKWRVYR